MQFIYDNIIAVMVGSVVLLILASNLQAGQKESIDATAFYSLNRHVASFNEVVLNDARSLSRPLSVQEVDSSFQFFALVSPGSSAEQLVEYRRTLGEVYDGVQTYRIRRFVDDQPDGGAAFELADWQIEFLDITGVPASGPDDAAGLHLRLDAMTPIARSAASSPSEFEDSRWETIIYPPILNPLF
jgi:hypothetical protein